MEESTSVLSTFATLFAAIAAIASYIVSRNSLNFQKNYAKNQNLINEINSIIYKIETLQILVPKPLDISDEEFESIEPLLEKIKSELERLDKRNLINYNELKISSVENILHITRDMSSLEEIIDLLEREKNKVFN